MIPSSAQRRNAFTLVELLVVIAIIGLLVALILPAVNSARSASRRTVCQNKIRQLALGTINHESARGFFPPARIEPRPGDVRTRQCGGESVSWVVHVMPYIEENVLYKQWNILDSYRAHPLSLRTKTLDAFVCPERRSSGDALPSLQLAMVEVEQPINYKVPLRAG